MGKKKGFTLIELLVVVSLLVVVTSLVTARFVQSFESRSMDHFVREFAAYLRYVQFKAIEDGVIYKTMIDEDTGQLKSLIQEDRESDYEVMQSPFLKKLRFDGTFSIHLEKGGAVYFFPDGSVTENTFLITNEMENLASIKIKNRLGAFEVITHV